MMTTAFPPRPAGRAAKRAKAIGESECLALFNLLPAPALLLDRAREQIAAVNSPLLKLTTFSLNDLTGRPLSVLVSDLPEHDLAADDLLLVTLERRSRPKVPANMQVRALDPEGQWLVLQFEPVEERRDLIDHMDQIARALMTLNQVDLEVSIRQNLERVLETVRQMLNVNAAALYSPQGSDPLTVRMTGVGELDLLPEAFPSSDLLRLAQTFLWKPGRRVQTELHRFARIGNLSCLATVPLRQNRLLVIADRTLEPSEPLQIVAEAIGEQISGMVDHMEQLHTLRRQSLQNRRELAVWRSVGENTQEGILLLAPDFTVAEMNPAAEWMLGYADWEVKGQPVVNILIGPEGLNPALEMAHQGIPTHNMGNVSLHRRNGQAFPAYIQVIPVEREGEPLAIIVFFRDVSEHEEISKRTQQLEQRAVLGEVTAVFAHEVRNPINNISTGLQLLSVKLPENDPNQENINRLLNDCQRLNHLMESVLNFSRHTEHKFEAVDLQMLLNRLLDRWRPRMAKVNVNALIQVEEGTPHVLADPRSLEQVFTNLVSNAVDAMSAKGGTLALRAAPYQGGSSRPQVEITVSDNGPGIPDEVRDRIFEPFVTTKSQGTGLGLAITKRIVTAHHGSLSVNSFPGGTVFHVLLSAFQGENE